jgi:hypothetical protein
MLFKRQIDFENLNFLPKAGQSKRKTYLPPILPPLLLLLKYFNLNEIRRIFQKRSFSLHFNDSSLPVWHKSSSRENPNEWADHFPIKLSGAL